jgi:hypothetical protein
MALGQGTCHHGKDLFFVFDESLMKTRSSSIKRDQAERKKKKGGRMRKEKLGRNK